MIFQRAADIDEMLTHILGRVDFPYVIRNQIVAIRSRGSRSRARARIWAFPTIWQEALRLKPHYVIEVLSEHFDHLSGKDQTKILIHELLHIPRTFSGALRPHRTRSFHLASEVSRYYRQYLRGRSDGDDLSR